MLCRNSGELQQVLPILIRFIHPRHKRESLLMRTSTEWLRSVAAQSPRGVKVLNTTRTVISFFFSPWQSRESGCHLFHRGSRSMPQQFSRNKEFNGHSSDSGEELDVFLFSWAHYHLLVKVKRKVTFFCCF